MRRVLPLLAIAFLLSGCFVFDEIDAGMEMMDKGPKKEEPAPEPAGGAAKKPAGQEWWSTAKSLSREDADAAPPGDPQQLVTCRIGGGSRFMRRGDCVSQGGAPKG
jgi:hypothetical protein